MIKDFRWPTKQRVYLAGAINGCSDWEAKGWREEAKRWLYGFEILDPMDRDYRGKEDQNVDAIVEGDKSDFLSCQKILAMGLKPSWGTAMEIHAAWSSRIPVFTVVYEGISVSPWLRYHSKAIYPTLRDACLAITDSPLEIKTR